MSVEFVSKASQRKDGFTLIYVPTEYREKVPIGVPLKVKIEKILEEPVNASKN